MKKMLSAGLMSAMVASPAMAHGNGVVAHWYEALPHLFTSPDHLMGFVVLVWMVRKLGVFSAIKARWSNSYLGRALVDKTS